MRRALPSSLVGLLVATALIGGCSPVSPTSSAATQTALPTLAPTDPEAVVVRLARSQGIGPFMPSMTIYEGGRLLTLNDDHMLEERRLSHDGIEMVREAMLDTGLFGESGDYPLVVREGAEPPGIEVPADLFVLATDAGVIRVTTSPFEDPTWLVPSPERDALAELATRLGDLSWLAEDAWVLSDAAPYAARAYLLLGGDSSIAFEIDPSEPDMADVSWPLPGSPEALGRPFTSADGAQSIVDRCLVIGGEALSAVNAALRAGGADDLGPDGTFVGSLVVPWRSRGIEVTLEMRPLLPEETTTCSGKSLPPDIAL